MIDNLVFCVVFAANIYSTSELTDNDTQVINSESMIVLDEDADSYKVLLQSGDKGWVKKSEVAATEPFANVKIVDSLKAHIYKSPSVMQEPAYSVPYSAKVDYLGVEEGKWLKVVYLSPSGKKEGWIQKKDVVDEHSILDADSSITFAERFLERPYTWGGTSSDGLDCSGLVKTVFKRRGLEMPHSASKQSLMGLKVEKENLKRGDLVFFQRNNKIVHVGLYRGDGTFIHACAHETGRPAVRINHLNEPIWEELYATARRVFP